MFSPSITKATNERLATAIEAAGVGIFDLNMITGELNWSAKAKELFGVSQDITPTAELFMQLVHPEDLPYVQKASEYSIDPQLRKPYDVEFRVVNPSATGLRWLNTKGRIYFTEENLPFRFIGTFVDITERKKVEHALRQSNEQFKALADSLPQIVWTAQPNGHLDYYNQRWYDFTGAQKGYGDESWIPILHPDDVQPCLDTWYASVRTGEIYQIEYRFKDYRNSNYRWFLGRATPLKDEEGNIVKWFGTCTDIHEQKTLTEELEKRVQERTEKLQQANRQLERTNKELEQFASVASHDLKEPLRKITTFISIMESELGDIQNETIRNAIEKVHRSANRMTVLINNILNFSRLDSLPDEKEEVNLEELVQEITHDLELMIQQKNATIKSRNLPGICAIPVQMSQLFYNLIHNGIKFSRPDTAPVVEIKSEVLPEAESKNYPHLNPQYQYYHITCTDNGIGFDETYAEKIFVLFQRLHSKNTYEGTGIGLALCKKIVHNHGGEIYAASQKGAGTTFHVFLPKANY